MRSGTFVCHVVSSAAAFLCNLFSGHHFCLWFQMFFILLSCNDISLLFPFRLDTDLLDVALSYLVLQYLSCSIIFAPVCVWMCSPSSILQTACKLSKIGFQPETAWGGWRWCLTLDGSFVHLHRRLKSNRNASLMRNSHKQTKKKRSLMFWQPYRYFPSVFPQVAWLLETKQSSAYCCVRVAAWVWALSDQCHDAQMVAGVASVMFGGGVSTVRRGGGRCQGLGGGGSGQGPRSQRHVETIHAAAVHARLDVARSQVCRFSLHLNHPEQ